MKDQLMTITRNEALNDAFYRLDLVAHGAIPAKPGQFLNVRVGMDGTPLLRRPFSVYQNIENGYSVLYKLAGKGTNKLSGFKPGTSLSVLGPLGNGFPLPDPDVPVLLAGGGIGIPPIAFLAASIPNPVVVCLGFQTVGFAYVPPEFSRAEKTIICTDDGSEGIKGNVLDGIASLGADVPEIAYACGPDAMLRALSGWAAGKQVELFVSVEEFMGCGIGICLSCAVPVKGGSYVRACTEGPVFKADVVDWEK